MMLAFLPYHLDLTPDQTWKAQLSWHYFNKAEEIDQTEVEEVGFHVVSKDGDKYKITISRKQIRTEFPGVKVNTPANIAPQSQDVTVDSTNLFVLPNWTLDENTKRLSRLFDFGKLPPVETWQVHTSERGLPDTDAVFEEVNSPDPTMRFWRWELKEATGAPRMTAHGFLWTRKKDGLPLSLHIDAENAVLPGGTDTVGLTVDLRVLPSEAPKDGN